MRRLQRTGIAVAALAVAGCAGNDSGGTKVAGIPMPALPAFLGGEPDPPLTPAEQRLREDARTFNATVLGGVAYNAAIGATIGAIAGFLNSGGDMSETLKYAAIGTAAGGVYGAIDGYRTATKQEAARAQVREIEVMIDKVEVENAKIEESIRTTDAVISETRAKLASAQEKLARQEITAAEFERDVSRAKSNVAELDKLIAGIESRRDEFSQIAQAMEKEGEDTTQLEAEIAQSSQRLAQLKSERDLLAQDLEVSRIG